MNASRISLGLRTSAALALLTIGSSAFAVPFLQLDIADGFYDASGDYGNPETVVTGNTTFTLYAHAERDKKLSDSELLGDSFFLSIALTPNTGLTEGIDIDAGSFSVTDPLGNLLSFNATSDMLWGVPPVEADGTAEHDARDLARHSVFETYFIELEFNFDASQLSGAYNVQDDAGLGAIAGTDMFYQAFEFDTGGLATGYGLHFDLYHQKVKNGDYDVDYFAPFSKDAGTFTSVPSPSSLGILLTGFLLLVGRRIKF